MNHKSTAAGAGQKASRSRVCRGLRTIVTQTQRARRLDARIRRLETENQILEEEIKTLGLQNKTEEKMLQEEIQKLENEHQMLKRMAATQNPIAQGQTVDGVKMPATVYTGVLRSLEDVIKAHLQLPSHLRTVSADIPNDSEFGTLKSNVPYEGPQTVLKYFDLGHELDIDFLVSAEESGFDDAGADSRGL